MQRGKQTRKQARQYAVEHTLMKGKSKRLEINTRSNERGDLSIVWKGGERADRELGRG